MQQFREIENFSTSCCLYLYIYTRTYILAHCQTKLHDAALHKKTHQSLNLPYHTRTERERERDSKQEKALQYSMETLLISDYTPLRKWKIELHYFHWLMPHLWIVLYIVDC